MDRGQGGQSRAGLVGGANAGAGFPGQRIIDAIFLKVYGPELYARWGAGKLSGPGPEVKSAWEKFGRVLATVSHNLGGTIGALSTPISTGNNWPAADPATCQIALWGVWVPSLIDKTIDFTRVPASKPEFHKFEMFQSPSRSA